MLSADSVLRLMLSHWLMRKFMARPSWARTGSSKSQSSRQRFRRGSRSLGPPHALCLKTHVGCGGGVLGGGTPNRGPSNGNGFLLASLLLLRGSELLFGAQGRTEGPWSR